MTLSRSSYTIRNTPPPIKPVSYEAERQPPVRPSRAAACPTAPTPATMPANIADMVPGAAPRTVTAQPLPGLGLYIVTEQQADVQDIVNLVEKALGQQLRVRSTTI